mgnify:CR=1 FL=1
MGVQIGAQLQHHKFQGLELYQRIAGQGAPLGLEVEREIQSGKQGPLLRASLWEYFLAPFCWKERMGQPDPPQDGIEP